MCCWLPRCVMACRYFDAEANLVTIHVEASKCRQSALNHRVRRRQTDAEIIRSVHDAAGQHEDITIGKPVPLALGISFGPFDPQIERALRQQNLIACISEVAVSRSPPPGKRRQIDRKLLKVRYRIQWERSQSRLDSLLERKNYRDVKLRLLARVDVQSRVTKASDSDRATVAAGWRRVRSREPIRAVM